MTGSVTRRSAIGGIGAVLALGLAACADRAEAIGLYNWDSYIGVDTLARFTRATGTAVDSSTFANDDELYAKLAAGSSEYDVVVPSHVMLQRLVADGLVRPLDHALLANFANVAPAFRNPAYDPGNHHSVPYAWQVQGIGYRTAAMRPASGVPDSWQWLLASDAFARRIAVPGDFDLLFQIAALAEGDDLKRLTPAVAQQVGDLVRRQKPRIAAFHADDGATMLARGQVDIAGVSNTAAARAMADHPGLGFVVPREGGLLSADVLAIPARAPHVRAAHALIDALLAARAAADLALATGMPSPNAAARALLPAPIGDSPTLYPDAATLARSRYMALPSPATAKAFDAAALQVRAA